MSGKEKEKEPFTSITDDNIQNAVNDWYYRNEEALTNYGHISDWDTSNVTDMSLIFMKLSTFNDDISNWNVSNVTDMSRMFWKAKSFNQPLGNWERKNDANEEISTLKNVTDMEHMFYRAEAFNQDLKSWNIKEVIFPEVTSTEVSDLLLTDDKFKLEFHIFPAASNMKKDNYPLLGDAKEGYDKKTVFDRLIKNSLADINHDTTSKFKEIRQAALEIIRQRVNVDEAKYEGEYEGHRLNLGGKKKKTMKKKKTKKKKTKKKNEKRRKTVKRKRNRNKKK